MTPDIHSYSLIIKEGIFARIKQLPIFESVKRFASSPMRQIQPEHIPYLGCYLSDEQMLPDGDPNAAEPRFIHNVKVSFSVVIQNNIPDAAEENLDAAHWAIMNYLTRQDWHRFPMPKPFPPVEIEGIAKGSRQHIFGNATKDNETPYAELRMDLTVKHRTSFRPVITDDLDSIHVLVAYPWPYDPNAEEPFLVVYDLKTQAWRRQ